ncbi:ATP-binding protein [Streptomyces sp. NPDC008122]|uniref:ATP-binding protein n=1 Tax=Streptomyces sp. NPDC008122 TaxID=3364810 RepID=UPI0036E5669A
MYEGGARRITLSVARSAVRSARAADSTGRLGHTLHVYLQPHVLVVDEVGHLPLEREEGSLVFQLISGRTVQPDELLFRSVKNVGCSAW